MDGWVGGWVGGGARGWVSEMPAGPHQESSETLVGRVRACFLVVAKMDGLGSAGPDASLEFPG